MALTKINNNSLSAVTTLPAAIATGSLIKISTQTPSSASSVQFTSGLTSAYNTYFFTFNKLIAANDSVNLQFNVSTDGGSNYNISKTNGYAVQYNNASANDVGITYDAAYDNQEGTGNSTLAASPGNVSGTGESVTGYGYLYDVAATNVYKRFDFFMSYRRFNDYITGVRVSGEAQTKSAVNAVIFQYASGNIASGNITMYGVKQ